MTRSFDFEMMTRLVTWMRTNGVRRWAVGGIELDLSDAAPRAADPSRIARLVQDEMLLRVRDDRKGA